VNFYKGDSSNFVNDGVGRHQRRSCRRGLACSVPFRFETVVIPVNSFAANGGVVRARRIHATSMIDVANVFRRRHLGIVWSRSEIHLRDAVADERMVVLRGGRSSSFQYSRWYGRGRMQYCDNDSRLVSAPNAFFQLVAPLCGLFELRKVDVLIRSLQKRKVF
jgi:hypothetical protein